MILFIDDDDTRLGPWTSALTDSGYRVHIETHPDNALEVLRSGRKFTGAVLDIMLPAGSLGADRTDYGLRAGLVLIEEIRKLMRERNTELPAVVLSIRNDLREEVTNKMGIPFVSKSLDLPSDLVAALRDLGISPDREDKDEN